MAENLVICVARQFGSGGHAVGQALAGEMGLAFYDKALLKAAAEKSGILEELFEKNDEKPAGGLLHAPNVQFPQKAPSYADYIAYMPNDRMQNALADTIREAAQKSSCVIIGRCADYVLRGLPGMVSVFIHAPMEQRVKRIAKMHNLDEDRARSLIRKTDRSRANYYSYYTDRDWGRADNYDLVLNAGRLGTEKSVQLLKQAAAHFAP